jgi:DNA polymerase-3 subunit epsilon
MRELVIDTETTGLDPKDGHRICEVAVIELMNHLPTGKFFHRYCNPERDMPEGAFAVHGLSAEFLTGHPVFAVIAGEFLEFIGTDPLVIHNAAFDMAFLNAELKRAGLAILSMDVTDTLHMARKRFPGQPASLDALCRRFAIDLATREKHGARIDGELLAAVYLELIGGRQPGFDLAEAAAVTALSAAASRISRPARPHVASADELLAHAAFLAKIKTPIWKSEP